MSALLQLGAYASSDEGSPPPSAPVKTIPTGPRKREVVEVDLAQDAFGLDAVHAQSTASSAAGAQIIAIQAAPDVLTEVSSRRHVTSLRLLTLSSPRTP